MFTIESLGKQLAMYAQQRLDSQQLTHQLSGAMQVVEAQLNALKDAAAAEAIKIAQEAEAAAKLLAEQEAAKIIDSAVPGAGEAVMDALVAAAEEPTNTAEA